MRYRLLILFIFICSVLQNTHAQFVDIRIDLSATNELKVAGDAVMGVRKGVVMQWIGISLSENIEMGIGIKYRDLITGENRIEMQILNDNSSDFTRAVTVGSNYIATPACINNKMVHEMRSSPVRFTVWIGVPALQISELLIVYD
jgi:hypothetical protein